MGDFEIDRYLGTWYEIARLPHSFEKNLDFVTATYTLNDNGAVNVENKGYDRVKGEWRMAKGRAYFKHKKDQALLKVTFFWPFYGTYKVILLDKENYSYALVTSDTYKYLWILARSPNLTAETLSMLVDYARKSGFDVSRLVYVKQNQ